MVEEFNSKDTQPGGNNPPEHIGRQETESPEVVLENKMNQVEGLTEEAGEDVNSLVKELDEIRAKAEEYLDGWQRARAEFANYKKRIEKEQSQTYRTMSGNIIKQFLEVLDDLQLALKNRPQGGEGAEWAEGIELIFRKLSTILENEGVILMDAQGKEFDPNFHEAVTSEENSGFESGVIIEVLKPGYLVGDRVLRPAVVRVAK